MTPAIIETESRLDVALVAAGLVPSRTRAAKALAGGRVTLDGEPATRASVLVRPGQVLSLLSDDGDRWVGRAALKLLGALDSFSEIDPRGALCLDAGASTGGFTQVLLEAGASHVHAVDVGHDQLHQLLRDDTRVTNHEGVNVRGIGSAFVPGGVDLVVGDLSFISLKLVMAPLCAATRPGGELLLMVKPQFEIGRDRLSRTGVVHDAGQRREAVAGVVARAHRAGLLLLGVQRSPLTGQDGNAEFFLHLRKPESAPDAGSDAERDELFTSQAALDSVDYG